MTDSGQGCGREPLLQLEGVSAGYGHTLVLEGVTFQLERGQILALVGPNGAGKSTLIKALIRQLPESDGSILLDGRPLALYSGSQLARMQAVVLTERIRPALMTCREVVEAGRYPYTGPTGRLQEADRAAVRKAMKDLEVQDLADKRYLEVSDGQKQRVLIARALAQKPSLLLLDEPTSYLDIRYRKKVLQVFRHLAQEGTTIILSIHEVEDALKYSDRLLLVQEGEPARLTTPGEALSGRLLQGLFDLDDETYEDLFGHLSSRTGSARQRLSKSPGGNQAESFPHYQFFSNRSCEYFPCHKTDHPEDFNCLFCYCPLYSLGDKCGGNPGYTASGIKDCTNCLFPHRRGNYDRIMARLREQNGRRAGSLMLSEPS